MTLLADREYIGKDWFKYLKTNNIHFVIRLRLGDYFEDVNAAKGKDYERMLTKCCVKSRLVKKQIVLEGRLFTIIMMPNPKTDADEPAMIFLTTLPQARKASELYAKRWKIKCLFRHLKTNGYNLEDLNLKDPKKNLLMLGIVTTAYILAVREGWRRRNKISQQQYKDGSETPEVSIFREGLAILTAKCFRFIDFLQYLFRILNPKNHTFFQKCPVVCALTHFL